MYMHFILSLLSSFFSLSSLSPSLSPSLSLSLSPPLSLSLSLLSLSLSLSLSLLSLLSLSLSFSQGNIPIFQLLIKKGASLFDKDNASRTVMHWAATSGNVRQQTMMTQQIYNIPVQLYNDNTIMCIHVHVCTYMYTVHVQCMCIIIHVLCMFTFSCLSRRCCTNVIYLISVNGLVLMKTGLPHYTIH